MYTGLPTPGMFFPDFYLLPLSDFPLFEIPSRRCAAFPSLFFPHDMCPTFVGMMPRFGARDEPGTADQSHQKAHF